ncbi:hypothetical protein QJS04_geneDACA004274 [Acorus gramineus]|uniref:Uncharacterized protein n=1 Tax=Acorus gramineus TaxID=55184 RepID=A0AAV9B4E9_ACOGR|nr:hypothetical protein QJS04_geneDACA004274 [Acorus gramineus]
MERKAYRPLVFHHHQGCPAMNRVLRRGPALATACIGLPNFGNSLEFIRRSR